MHGALGVAREPGRPATVLEQVTPGRRERDQGGQYADLFDHVEDSLTFARFQCFDFEGMDRYPQVLEPLLFYVLHRANAAIYDPAQASVFKLFVLDEAWRFMRDPTINAYITEALKTWRKQNAAVILATQSSEDLTRSAVLRVVVESSPRSSTPSTWSAMS
jgi:type IV secretion system protein VirB4